jgi:hypothetical protein
VQYKREGEGPLLRLYKTEVAKVSPQASRTRAKHRAPPAEWRRAPQTSKNLFVQLDGLSACSRAQAPTWVIGAKDEAIYLSKSDSRDPPASGWVSASAAADPAPAVRLLWPKEGQAPLSPWDRVHLSLAFGPDDVTQCMSSVLPVTFVLFCTGLAILAVSAAPLPPPLPPILTGHVSSLLPY